MPLNLNSEIERVSKTTPVRTAWKILGSLFAGLLLLFGTMQVAVALAHEEYTDTDSFDVADVAVVDIHNSAGSVRVSPAPPEADTIEVVAEVSDGLRETGHSEELDDDRLMLRASCPIFGSHFCDVDYVLQVPAEVQLVVRAKDTVTVSDMAGGVDLESTNSVEVAGLTGPARLRAVDGSVRATDLRSDVVDASTISGAVIVDFDRAPRSVRAENIDGDVEVIVPNDPEVAYRVDASTVDGDTSTDILNGPQGDRSIVARTISGDVRIRYS